MDINEVFNGNLGLTEFLVCCLRLVIACGCGALIGLERSRNFKEAGLRTHIIVCCGAALCMIISKYGFADIQALAGPNVRVADHARIAAQVISGISFIGAGVIFKRDGLVKGLTTAAGIWATSAIGLAIGSGIVTIGVFTTVLILVLQHFLHQHTFGPDAYYTSMLRFTVQNGHKFNKTIHTQLETWDATIIESSYDRSEEKGTTDYGFTVRRKTPLTYTEMRQFIETHPEVLGSKFESVNK